MGLLARCRFVLKDSKKLKDLSYALKIYVDALQYDMSSILIIQVRFQNISNTITEFLAGNQQ